MYTAIPHHQTCASAWFSAVRTVNAQPDHEAYNVVIDITDPLKASAHDKKVITLVNGFLEEHESPPLQTVANTIFPYSLYERYGAPRFYDAYLKIYPKIKQQGWGRYFERMIKVNANGVIINPLGEIVNKLRNGLEGNGRLFHNTYELATYDPAMDIRIYDPSRDASRNMNRQCLSFLSFKINRKKELSLTAVYRNHYYIARLLGNLIGLGRLLEFVTKETGAKIGALTIISTHAQVDTDKWTRKEIENLMDACETV